MDQKSMVSVVMITYNHEKYIAEAMNGVFMQKCDFDIEFIIANDKSTDHTNQTINEIIDQTTIADHIKLRYYNHPNNKGMMKNFIWSLNQAKGKYIALCEGDDYWTDPLKLQKQVDFLEGNEEYVVTADNAKVVNLQNELLKEFRVKPNVKLDYSELDLKKAPPFPTNTIVFRNEDIIIPQELANIFSGDRLLVSLLGSFGKGYFNSKRISAVYRFTGKGMSTSTSYISGKKRMLESNILFYKYYKNDHKLELHFKNKIKVSLKMITNYYLNNREFINFSKYVVKLFKYDIIYGLKLVMYYLSGKKTRILKKIKK
jgi:glycosyltransferase involved in cell wall biosynthesis